MRDKNMQRDDIARRVAEMAAPVITSLGLTLWGVETVMGGKGQTIRIYIESGEADADVGALAEVSRTVGLQLDVEDFVPGAYRLEVSSPGFERPFFSPEQAKGYVGEKVEVKLRDAFEGRKNFRGRLTSVEGDTLTLELDGETQTIDWALVRRVKLVIDDPWQYAKARKAASEAVEKSKLDGK